MNIPRPREIAAIARDRKNTPTKPYRGFARMIADQNQK
jgi:hypothetical protein